MSAPSVGIDLVEVAAVEAAIARHGRRYLERVYTPGELRDCGDPSPSPQRLAARFAAKEAAHKALGSGDVLVFHEIEVVVGAHGGAPTLSLHGATSAAAHQDGRRSISLSLTHEAGLAAAVVLALPDPSGGPR
ncbi:MAG: holo-ACP synthase [Gaiellales bacterium]